MTRLQFAPLSGLVLLIAAAFMPAAQPPGGAPPKVDPSLESIPRDGFFVASVKVSDLWDQPTMKPVRDWVASQKEGLLESAIGVGVADLDRVTAFIPALARGDETLRVLMVTTRKPYNEARVLKNLGTKGPLDRREPGKLPDGAARRIGNVIQLPDDRPFHAVALVNDQTLVFIPNHTPGGVTSAVLIGQLLSRNANGPLAGALAAASSHTIAVGIDVPQFAADLARGLPGRESGPYAALLKAKTATLTADIDKGLRTQVVLTFEDGAAAKRGGPVLEEALADLVRELDETAKVQAGRGDAGKSAGVMLGWFRDVLKGAKVEVKGETVVAAADTPIDESLGKLIAALPKSLAAFRSRAEATNNLKQIVIALHGFHDANGYFPGDIAPNGKSAWSWRVQILPFIEQDALYKKLDFTRPWDDPQNKAVLEKAEMPKVYEVPGRPAPKGHTYWRSFSRPKNSKEMNTRPWLIEGERGPQITSITDGTSNSIAVVEAGEAVPWYAPDVLAFDEKLPLPPLGDKDTQRFLAGMGDGSVRTFRTTIAEKTLRAIITINGGEVVDVPDER